MFPGFDNIYYIGQEDLTSRSFHASLEGHPPQTELLRGDWKPEVTLQANWSMGHDEPQDIVWGLTTAWIYISPKVQK